MRVSNPVKREGVRRMREHRRQTKGFTLVELLVVIAILAVLTTVSVVTYTSFLERAKLFKDSVLLEQCNTVLGICAVYDGPNRTMAEALSDLSENGIEVAKLTASTKDCDIVWNRTDDLFLLMRDGTVLYPNMEESVSLSDCFLPVHSTEETKTEYSVYLAKDFAAGTELCLNNVGLDDGGCAVSFSLTGDTAEELVLNTVGGNATVNLPQGTVYHYGNADCVTVEAIGEASYHVYGQMERLTLYKGHLVLEAGATVRALNIEGGTVLCQKGATVSVSAEDAASIENCGGTVNLLPTQCSGASESTATEVPETSGAALFAGGDGSQASPYLISTPQQFSAIAALMEDNYSEYEETINIPYLEEIQLYAAKLNLKDGFCQIRTAMNNNTTCKEPGTHDFDELPEPEQSAIRTLFEEHYDDWRRDIEEMSRFGLKYVIEEGFEGKVDRLIYYVYGETETTETLSCGKQYYYFRLTASVALPDDYTPLPIFYGELDGAGYTLYAPEESVGREQSCVIFEEALGGSVFRNFEFCLSQQPYSLVGGDGHRSNGSLQFEEITVTNREEGTCVQVLQDGFGALTRYALHSWNAEVLVKNCVNRADFDFHGSASAVFVGERYLELYPKYRERYDNSTATFVSCNNFGSLSGTSDCFWYIGVLSTDESTNDKAYTWLTVETCTEQAE